MLVSKVFSVMPVSYVFSVMLVIRKYTISVMPVSKVTPIHLYCYLLGASAISECRHECIIKLCTRVLSYRYISDLGTAISCVTQRL